MKITAFIPIKLNNERLPGKNTKCFSDGTPLCHIIQKEILRVSEITEVFVFCSSEEIIPYILPGVNFMKRSASLDTQATLCSDLILAFMDMHDSDIYVMANATSPFVSAERYKACIRAVASGAYDSAFACEKISEFIWYNKRPLNYNPIHIPRTQDLEPVFRELSSPYVFTKNGYKENGSRIGRKPFMCECSKQECVDIDYPEDFIMAEIIYSSMKKK